MMRKLTNALLSMINQKDTDINESKKKKVRKSKTQERHPQPPSEKQIDTTQ